MALKFRHCLKMWWQPLVANNPEKNIKMSCKWSPIKSFCIGEDYVRNKDGDSG